MRKEKYLWKATTPEGFVRHLVTYVLTKGYRFYVCGSIKPSTDVDRFDSIMEEKFAFKKSRSQRNRSKNAVTATGKHMGLANVHYLRYERFYILISTYGSHPFFELHTTKKQDRNGDLVVTKHYRDAHRDPIFFDGYSIRIDCEGGYKPKKLWKEPGVPEFDSGQKVRVRIARDVELTMRTDLIARAKSAKWSVPVLEAEIRKVPYLRYAPVRQQLRDIVRAMNRARGKRGFNDRLDPKRCISRYIPPISAFAIVEEASKTVEAA